MTQADQSGPKPTTKPTSEKLRHIRQALPVNATAAIVQLDRIILEVEILEGCRAALDRQFRLCQVPPPAQHKPLSEVAEQSTIDF